MPGWLLSIAGPVMAVAVIGCQGSRSEDRSGCAGTNIARWLAIGCQIQLLTSNLVWYHYFILSIPAMLVVLREVSAVTGRFDKCIIGAIAVWCLLLLGLEPIDELLQSPPNEHMWRCLLANLMLIVLLVSFAALRRNHSNNWLCSHRG